MAGSTSPFSLVLVVDDDDAFRECTLELLRSAGFCVQVAATGEEALAAADRERPGVIVLDVHLAGMSGYEVLQRLREQHGIAIPIVFVSGERIEAYDRSAGLLFGADDYLVKPVDPGELIARVRALLRRQTIAAEPVDGKMYGDLTPRERQVLTLLARGQAQREIAEHLVITPKTVATHIQHVLSKLDVHSRAQAVALAHREHIVDVEPHLLSAEPPA